MEVNPYESPETVEPARPLEMQDVLRRLRIPVLGLMVTSIVHLSVLGLLLLGLLAIAAQAPSDEGGNIFCCGVVTTAVLSIPALIQLLGLRAALREERLWTTRFVMLIACLPILTPALVLGIPFGVWGLIILFAPGTAGAFARGLADVSSDENKAIDATL